MKLLDLFCGIGGASIGYFRAMPGIKITGIDINYKVGFSYPFHFICCDAVEYLRQNIDKFDFIHASPPCQKYSKSTAVHRSKGKMYNDYLDEVISILRNSKKPYVIENVLQAEPLRADLILSGYMFGLKLIKTRKFELSFDCEQPAGKKEGSVKAGDYAQIVGKGQYASQNSKTKFKESEKTVLETWKKVMKIENAKTPSELAEAIPPAYTEYIFSQYLKNQNFKTMETNTTTLSIEEIVILPELKNLIPPLTIDEYQNLEKSIVQQGCLSPILLWNNEKGEKILIDGHNRYSICVKHKINFDFNFLEFSSLDHVKEWMIQNQHSRRNVNKLTKAYLIGMEYNLIKKNKADNFKKTYPLQKDMVFKTDNTAEILAEKYKESKSNINRYAKFYSRMVELSKIDEITKTKILESESSFTLLNNFFEVLEGINYKVNFQKYNYNNIDFMLKQIIKENKATIKEIGKFEVPKYQNETLDNTFNKNTKEPETEETKEITLQQLAKSYNNPETELKAQIEGLKQLNEQYLKKSKDLKEENENIKKLVVNNSQLSKYTELEDKYNALIKEVNKTDDRIKKAEEKGALDYAKILETLAIAEGKASELERKLKNDSLDIKNLPSIRIVKCIKLCEAGFKLFRANYTNLTIEKFDVEAKSFLPYKREFTSANQIDKYLFIIDAEEWEHIILLPKGK